MFDTIYFQSDNEPIFVSGGGIEDDSVFAGADSRKNKRSKASAFIGYGQIETDASIENLDTSELSVDSPVVKMLVKSALTNKSLSVSDVFAKLIQNADSEGEEQAALEFTQAVFSESSPAIPESEKHQAAYSLLTLHNDKIISLLSPFLAEYMVSRWTDYNIKITHQQEITIFHNFLLSVEYVLSPLIKSLNHKSSYVRVGAWQILLHIFWDIYNRNLLSFDEVTKIISDGMRDNSFVVRYYAIQLARKVNDVRVLPLLASLLSHKHDMTRIEAAYAISQTYGKEKLAIDNLISAYEHEKNRDVKKMIGFCLGNKYKIGIRKLISEDAQAILWVAGLAMFIIAINLGQLSEIRSSPYFLWIVSFLCVTVYVIPYIYIGIYSVWAFFYTRHLNNFINAQFKAGFADIMKEKPSIH